MRDRICSVAICTRDAFARGLCRAHYTRLNHYGDTMPDKPIRESPKAADRSDVTARIMAKSIRRSNGCIEWQGLKNHAGYGEIGWRGRKNWLTHRAIWTHSVGPLPTDDNMTIDHLCRNRACVNVAHMEIVTRAENTERGGGLLVAQARNPRRATCRNGHLYANHPVRRDRRGHRVCRDCAAARRSGDHEALHELEASSCGTSPAQRSKAPLPIVGAA